MTDTELVALALTAGVLTTIALGITLGLVWSKTIPGDPTNHRHRLYRSIALIAATAYAFDQTMDAASDPSVLHWLGAGGWTIVAVSLITITRTDPTRRTQKREAQ